MLKLKLWILCLMLKLNTLSTWCEELIHLKSPWCWERMKAGGEGDNRGWDGWMALPSRWTWVWVSSGSWWWTGKPGMLQSMGSQRIRHEWVTELNWLCFIRNEPSVPCVYHAWISLALKTTCKVFVLLWCTFHRWGNKVHRGSDSCLSSFSWWSCRAGAQIKFHLTSEPPTAPRSHSPGPQSRLHNGITWVGCTYSNPPLKKLGCN